MLTVPKNLRRHSAFGFALACLFLVSQLSTFTHLMLVRHVTCLAHGDLIHVDDLGPRGSRVEEQRGPALAAAPSPVAEHGHDHCLVMASRREQLGTPASSTTCTRAVTFAVGVPVERAGSAGVALLRLAPKSSPPA